MPLGTTLRIAWRNLGRNRRRTALALAAIGVAEFVLVVFQGLLLGYADLTTASVTGAVIGHVQVHAPRWREDRAMERVVPDTSAALESIRALPGVTAASARLFGPALVAKAVDGHAAVVLGLDVERERRQGLLEEVALERSPGADEVLLGALLAQRLGASAGDSLALIGQAADGSVASGLYRVAGVISTSADVVNRVGVVMGLGEARALFAMGDEAHELFIVGDDVQQAEALAQRVSALPALAGAEVLPWRRLSPEFAFVLDFVLAYELILLILVFIASAAGAANTMMMATFERTRELGMLLGLGARPRRIVALVVVEGLLLGVLALALGAAAGAALITLTRDSGWELTRLASGSSENIAFIGLKWGMRVHPRLSVDGLWRSLVAVLVTSLLAALWPAVRAARLEPVEAMHA
jgi:putative ABC transport system permease protein